MGIGSGAWYGAGMALAVAGALFMVWAAGAVGLLAVEGDPADRAYLIVLGLGLACALWMRLEPRGMAYTLAGMATGLGVVALSALAVGLHRSPVSSVYEVLGVNAVFATIFCASAACFHFASRARVRLV